MNIEALAREAGGSPPDQRRNFWEFLPEALTRFAALVRAQALDDAARVCEETATCLLPPGSFLSERCAAAVRALKDKP